MIKKDNANIQLTFKRVTNRQEADITIDLDKKCFDQKYITEGINIQYEELPVDIILKYFTYNAYFQKIPVGYIRYHFLGDTLVFVSSICVCPEHKGKKIGSKILEYLQKKLLKPNVKTIKLITWKDNLSFYVKNGFRVFDIDEDFYKKGQNRYSLRKDLR
jgi:ribosomal protein S18 acetylase RimI-like enzyme